ncbi:hypothetical protein GmHk_U059783 [Glycine max]|nr:hypothetical protein GmHk_U059783 [Glycine max]
MRINMINLTQIRMAFLLSNILSKSDLTLPECQLVYNIIKHISVHVAQLISDAIHQFVGTEPPRHPVNHHEPPPLVRNLQNPIGGFGKERSPDPPFIVSSRVVIS